MSVHGVWQVWYKYFEDLWGQLKTIFRYTKGNGIFLRFGHLSFINQVSKKVNISWPQLPPTEKMVKFNISFHQISWFCQIFFFQSTKIDWYKSSDYQFHEPAWLSGDFPGLRMLCSLIDLTGLCNITGLNSLYSPFSSKNFLTLIAWSSQAPKWPILVIFCYMDCQKSNCLLMYDTTFCWRLLRSAYVTFLKIGWWNSNGKTSWTHYPPQFRKMFDSSTLQSHLL